MMTESDMSTTELVKVAVDEVRQEIKEIRENNVIIPKEQYEELQKMAKKGQELEEMEEQAQNAQYRTQSTNYAGSIGGSAHSSKKEDNSWAENRAGKRMEDSDE